MAQLPTGTVTFVFSDVEGSTRLLEADRLGTEAALVRHHEIFERLVADHGGAIFETVGDAVYAAFGAASDAVSCALAVQLALAREDWGGLPPLRVRIAIHAGEVNLRGDAHYSGPALFRTARLQTVAHGSQTLLSGVVARLVEGRLPPDANLYHHGTHRLKDLAEPEEVYELRHPDLPDRHPALRSLDAHPHNLPIQLSSFIGRDRELREIVDLLGSHRLVTLTGVGGTGKTRLSLQVAAERLDRHRDGAWFVDLAPLRDPELVLPVIASALSLRDQSGFTIDAALIEHLADRELLLVLDNCEQVIGSAMDIGRLLTSAPGLTVLATSRAPLRIRGEHEYRVLTLGTDDDQSVAVQLFLERAAAVRPDLPTDGRTRAALTGICRLLDGLPLAIELAAARCRMFDPPQLLQQLQGKQSRLGGGARDVPARQQSLREAIAWSEQLLTDRERRSLHRIAVFAGSFSADSAAAVVGDGEAEDTIDVLMALAEQSLVRRVEPGPDGEARFGMLETIRSYAADQLEHSGETDDAHDRLLGHYLDLAMRLYDDLEGPGLSDALSRLRVEWPNIHAILDWGIEARRPDAARLALKARQYWVLNGPSRDAFDVFERCLALDLPARLHAECLHLAGTFAGTMGLVEEGEVRLTGAASRFAEMGEDLLEGAALNDLGAVLYRVGDLKRQEEVALRSAHLFARAGYARGEALAVGNLGDVAYRTGRLDLALERFEDSLRRFRAVGDPSGIAWILAELVEVALDRGDTSTARVHAREAVKVARRGGDLQSRAEACLALSRVQWARGRMRTAQCLLDLAARDAEALGDRELISRIEAKRAEHAAASGPTGDSG